MQASPTKSSVEAWRVALVCLFLSAATLVVFWRVHAFDFVNFDDASLIYKNPKVTGGLTLENIKWGLTTSYYEYWHPLTWWSHMLDCELFGLNAGRHHLTSLAFHIANTLLLFAVFRQMTGKIMRSAIVAALFALHPMHVESAVWLAERKDVLSTFFWLLSIWAYARYVQVLSVSAERAEFFYRLSAVGFLCGVISKPMVVTLPFVLLLLDYWPLNRFQTVDAGSKESRLRQTTATLVNLAREKIPFFALTVFSCLLTYSNVKAAGTALNAGAVSWSFRLANVPVSYGRYLTKLVYPVDLSAFYPIPSHWPFWMVGISILTVLLITALVLKFSGRAPYLFFGWFVFLGTLVPTLSLVPVGLQSIADRYSYIPYIGLFVAGVWAMAEWSARWKFRTGILGGLTACVLIALSTLTWLQVGYWRNNFTLWPHCLAVTTNNFPAENNLGTALADAGKPAEALPYFIKAAALRPDFFDVNYNVGWAYLNLGQFKQAADALSKANRLKTNYPPAHACLGQAWFALGDYAKAEAECAEAARLDPSDANSMVLAARALGAQNKSNDAIEEYARAVQVYPANPEAHFYLGSEYLKHGMVEEAIASLNEALRLKPSYKEAQAQLDIALSKLPATKPPH